MIYRTFLLALVVLMKANSMFVIEKICYKRLVSGRRLDERFIRHSLPCDSLEACQHQCSTEKHFKCQGFSIRPSGHKAGGICELSSIPTAYLDLVRDFRFDPEFDYYERDLDNGTPNCGIGGGGGGSSSGGGSGGDGFRGPSQGDEKRRPQPPLIGGPYYGGDSYGPWSSGQGGAEHGPWGSHGYGSGSYMSNYPGRRPTPPNYPSGNYPSGGSSPGYPPGSSSPGNYLPGSPSPSGYPPGGSPPGGYSPPPSGYPPANYLPGGSSPGNYLPGSPSPGGYPPGNYIPGGTPGYLPGSPSPGGYPPPSGPSSGYPSGGYPPPSGPSSGYPSGGYPPGSPSRYPPGSPSPGRYPPGSPPPGNYLPGSPPPGGYAPGPYIPGSPPPGSYAPGFYTPNYPLSRYPPSSPIPGAYYGTGTRSPPYDFRANEIPENRHDKGRPSPYYPDRGYPPPRQNRIPPYIIIDSDRDRKPLRNEVGAYRPNYPSRPSGYGPGPMGGGGPGREVCFQRAHVGYRVDPKFVKHSHRAPTVLDCEDMCTKSQFKCTGYSFRYSNVDGGEPNCALTDIAMTNTKQNLLPDRSCDFYYRMPVCSSAGRSEDPECFLKTYSNQRIAPDKIRSAIFVRGVSDCELECLKSYHFTCRSFTFRYAPGVIGEPIENCFLSDWPVRDLHPTADYIPGPGCEVYERGSFGHGCEVDGALPSIGPGHSEVGYPRNQDKHQWNRQEMWRHFTVRGWPCRIGTQCQLNREAGFWSCEVEGGDRGQWDYCCKPGHNCGFSKGFYYPWCYVGEAGPEQWRPCSEQFYPDFGNRYSSRPSHTSNPHPSHSYDGPKGGGQWNYGQDDYGPPSYWPVLYLYAEPPPNATESWIHDDSHHSSYYVHEHYDEDPKIQFRPSKNKVTYPKGIVLKIDVKDRPQASDPGHEAHKDERPAHVHPRYNYRKNVDFVERVPVSDLNFRYFHSGNCDKQSLKLGEESSATSRPDSNSTNSKRGVWSTEKSKEVIRDVEKIIEEKAKDKDRKEEERNKEEEVGKVEKDSSEEMKS